MELFILFTQLETMISSGIPVVRALQLIGAGEKNPFLKEKILKIGKYVEKGSSLSDSMALVGHPFSDLQVCLIKFGEETGTLDEVCGTLALYAEKEQKLRRNILGALVYPCFVLAIATMVGPVVSNLTNFSLGIKLALANLGYFALALTLGYALFKEFEGGKFDFLLLQIPIIGGILNNLAYARFSRAFSVSQAVGIPLTQGIATAIRLTGNSTIQKRLQPLISSVEDGKSLTSGIGPLEHVPETLKEMILIGEQSGRLPESLEKSATFFEEEASHRMEMIVKILPSLVLLLVGIYVGFLIIQSYGQILVNTFPKIK